MSVLWDENKWPFVGTSFFDDIYPINLDSYLVPGDLTATYYHYDIQMGYLVCYLIPYVDQKILHYLKQYTAQFSCFKYQYHVHVEYFRRDELNNSLFAISSINQDVFSSSVKVMKRTQERTHHYN